MSLVWSRSFLALMVALALVNSSWQSQALGATTTTWLSPGSANWFVASNWDSGVPTASVLGLIDNGGTATIAAGSAAALHLTLGSANSGNVLQTGGSLTFNDGNNGLALAAGSASTGRYEIRDGTLTVFRRFWVGERGVGTFVQSGGHVTLTSTSKSLAEVAGSSGSYQLDGGLLDVLMTLSVGNNGSGQFLETAGQANINTLRIADGPASTGAFELHGGTLTTTTTGLGSGNASFEQTGGTHTATNLQIPFAQNASRLASYSLSGVSSVLHVSQESIGHQGNGMFVQSGGSHTVDGYMVMGFDTGVTSSYLLQSGNLTVGNEIIGSSSAASFVQLDGTHIVQQDLTVGEGGSPGFTAGDFSLQGGTLSVRRNELIAAGFGNRGTGAFHHLQGTHHVAGNLSIAKNISGTGLYELFDGGLQIDGSLLLQESLGAHATFRMIGGLGTVDIARDLIMGPSNRLDQMAILDEIIQPTGLSTIFIAGIAKLNGVLNVTVDPAVVLSMGEQFTVLQAIGGVQGGLILQGPDAADFRLDVLADRVVLTSLVPEPSSMLLALSGLALAMVGGIMRACGPRA